MDTSWWEHSVEVAADLLHEGICPVCGRGGWKSPLNHVSRKHGINYLDMRDVCGMNRYEPVTDPETHEKWRQAAIKRDAVTNARRGPKNKKRRRTKAFQRILDDGGNLGRWMRDHPDEMAEIVAGFRDRVTSPEALRKWEESMRQVWASQGEKWTDEQRAEFVARMQSDEVEAKRQAYRDATRIDVCTVEGCGDPHLAKGFCKKHYRRVQAHGDPHMVMKARLGKRVLTLEQMQNIVDFAAVNAATHKELAKRFNVSPSIIGRVLRDEYEPVE